MTLEVMQDYCTLLFVAGLDTVINGIGFGVRHLAQDHQLPEQLRSDPSMIPAAAEELLRRYTFTIPMRRVAEDTDSSFIQVVSPIVATPISYRANGKQFVTVLISSGCLVCVEAERNARHPAARRAPEGDQIFPTRARITDSSAVTNT